MKKNLMIAATVATIGLSGLGAAGLASAATDSSSRTSGNSSLVDKLVAKFGLKKADVQAVFDAERTEREAARTQKIADKLAAGVTAGTITQAQSDAITAKVKELQATHDTNRDKFKDMTNAERKTAMEAERTAMKTWITENDIPDEFARLLRKGGMHGGPGRSYGPHADSSTTN